MSDAKYANVFSLWNEFPAYVIPSIVGSCLFSFRILRFMDKSNCFSLRSYGEWNLRMIKTMRNGQ